MQIMSSPIMSDAADTPLSGSGGSPSPLSPSSTSHILDFSKKEFSSNKLSASINGLPSKLLEAPSSSSERSMSSSPAILVPTPRSTPPMNGILTPPNDAETTVDATKSAKAGGRLTFFKDGILCLELSHHGEGERTKWVQIRSKTVFPTLVHAKKEVTIPCHSTPSSFASPSSLTHTHRVESSTSHSLSDDACSMLSSPRTRENHWKQSVPQRGVSACLQFFMKPAPCALKLRSKLKEFYSQEQIRKRWPYQTRATEIFIKLKNDVQCCCDEPRVLTDSSSISAKNNSSSKLSSDENENVETSVLLLRKNVKPVALPRKTSLDQVIQHLEKVATIQKKLQKTPENVPGRRTASGKASLTPKKRLFNEVDAKEIGMGVRPKKKSPNRILEKGKTILNIPGLNSEFYRRHTPQAKSPGMDGADRSKSLGDGGVNKRRTRSPHFGAKSTSPSSLVVGSVLKPCLTGELQRYSPLSGSRTPTSEQMSQQEQQLFQQQTMSKAISYTINSLLGTGSRTGESPLLQAKKTENHKVAKGSSASPVYPVPATGHNSSIRASSHRADPDQNNCFLRHLLDTSDPIPPAKNSERLAKIVSRSRDANQSSNGKANGAKHIRDINSSAASTPKASHKASVSSSSSSPHIGAQPDNQSIAANIALSSLMSTFPLGLPPQYELLARGANPQHSSDAFTAAAAAAAALQYGSLLPGNMFPGMNSSTMAAAMASYFGMMPVPNFPVSSTPSHSSPPPHPPSSSSKGRRSQDPPGASSNQRTSWQPVVNGHSSPSAAPPFRTARSPISSPRNSQSSPGRTPSAIPPLEIPSCGALNLTAKKKSKVEEPSDIDAPLDLCKKPSR